MKLILSLLFLIPSIIIGIYAVKERNAKGIKKITTFLPCLYFGISWCLIFYSPNIWVAMFIWIHWLFLAGIFNIKTRVYSSCMLIIISISGMIISLIKIFSLEFQALWILWTILCVAIYLFPTCSYLDRKNKIIRKIRHCTEEVDAKIIKIYKGNDDSNHYHPVYIPKFEFELNGKSYKFMDSTEIYFRNKNLYSVGDTIKLFVSPNPQIDSLSECNDVFWPNPQKEHSFRNNIIFFYILTLLIFLIIILLRIYG